MANTSKFAFQAPNPVALDPSVLEQVYAGGAARKMGPAFNLVAGSLAAGDRRDSANAYLASVGDLNRRAQEAGRMQLESERLMEFIKQGRELAQSDPLFASTPLGQFALTMGQGGSFDLMGALAQIGVENNAAKRTEQVGSGISRLAEQGFRPPGGLTIDQLPTAPLDRGAPTSVMSAGVTANAMTKPRIEITKDPLTGQMTEKYVGPADPAAFQNTPTPAGGQAAHAANSAGAAKIVGAFGSTDGQSFVRELERVGASLSGNIVTRRGTFNIGGQTIQNAPVVSLPNGQTWVYANGKLVPVQK